MTNKTVLLFLFLATTLFSCSIEKKTIGEIETKLGEFVTESDLSGLKAIVILPGEGCSGCISQTEKFVKTLNPDDGVKVIFTAVRSLKVLRMKLKIDLKAHHFGIDKENIFNQGRTYSIYPTVVLLDNGKITDYIYVSPSNNFNLESLLTD